MKPKDRLKQAREAAGFATPSDAARAIKGLNINTLISNENGNREISRKMAAVYAKAFGVTPGWILFGEGSSEDHDVPATVSTVSGRKNLAPDTTPEIDVTAGLGGGGLSTHVVDSNGKGLTFTAELVRDYWRLPSWLHARINVPAQHLAAFAVQGDSMEPTLASGDTVFIDTRHRVPSPDGIYAIVDMFGGLIVKRLEVRDDRVRVISDNPRHSEYILGIDELMVIGRYVGRFTM